MNATLRVPSPSMEFIWPMAYSEGWPWTSTVVDTGTDMLLFRR